MRMRRFEGWDYTRGTSLFVTMSTEPRRPLFGSVAGGAVVPTALGMEVAAALEAMPRLNPGISLFGRVVMPDHVHFNCHVAAGLPDPKGTLGRAIRRFKTWTAHLARQSLYRQGGALPSGLGGRALPEGGIWQQGYHDRICTSRRMIDATERYIAYNPLKWELMHGAPEALKIREPLHSPRLDPDEYWKGVGNCALLDGTPLLALRVSRQTADTGRVVARMQDAVAKGYVIISGFISSGEQAVRDMLCATPGARFIRILPSSIPNARFKPESRYVAPFAEGRYLEIAQGNEETEFGREACLDLNAAIAEIATAGEGLAVYWRAQGPDWQGGALPSGLRREGKQAEPCHQDCSGLGAVQTAGLRPAGKVNE